MVISMKTARIRRKEEKKVELNNEEYSIKSMVKIIIIISILFCLFYFITTLIVKPNEKAESEVSLNENEILVSQLLNRQKDEYYVLAYKNSLYKNKGYMEVYNLYINQYLQKDEFLPFFYIDLDNALNKKHYSEDSNITNDLLELKLNDEVLFKIKDGKIEKTYEGKDKIIEKLSKL